MKQKLIFETPIWADKPQLTEEEMSELRGKALEMEAASEVNDEFRKSDRGNAVHSAMSWLGPFGKEVPGGKKIAYSFNEAAKQYGFRVKEASFSYWSIVSRKYSYNARHEHGSALLSGVLYVSVPENSGVIRFCDPRPTKRMLNSDQFTQFREANDPKHNDIEIKPAEGLLIVFPGWLEHEVTMTFAETPRIIYSFNMAPIK